MGYMISPPKHTGIVNMTQKQFHRVIKKAQKNLEKQLKLLRERMGEENIKSDFHMTHEIATISGEIKGILMIYEALEEVLNDKRRSNKKNWRYKT